MSFEPTVTAFAQAAVNKRQALRGNPLGFAVLAMMAGAYVGLGILLIFSVGQGVDPGIRPMVMGASFGLALLLVVFAGSELFTGHTMYLTHGLLTGRTGWSDLAACWAASWVGNLIGAFALAVIFVQSGGGPVLADPEGSLLHAVATKKMHGSGAELFFRGILCNWLVCLALWTAARAQSDMAKVALIWFCLYAFIASGFEHSVANMTIFSVALLSDPGSGITLGGAMHNLTFVSLGNAVAGAGIMGLGYWIAAGRTRADTL